MHEESVPRTLLPAASILALAVITWTEGQSVAARAAKANPRKRTVIVNLVKKIKKWSLEAENQLMSNKLLSDKAKSNCSYFEAKPWRRRLHI
jgi:hypothetical protein